ncbi:TIGR04076 family protein [candidate division WOR-3 bacterium]|nr:TIGR04076 family protein [candidate division WOR-3 bacterium]
MKKVISKVVGGRCNQGFHEVGDEYVVGDLTPEGICTSAFASIFPLILALQTGGKFLWEKDNQVTRAAYPDDDWTIFEIRSLE